MKKNIKRHTAHTIVSWPNNVLSSNLRLNQSWHICNWNSLWWELYIINDPGITVNQENSFVIDICPILGKDHWANIAEFYKARLLHCEWYTNYYCNQFATAVSQHVQREQPFKYIMHIAGGHRPYRRRFLLHQGTGLHCIRWGHQRPSSRQTHGW